MDKIMVNLGENSYNINVGNGMLKDFGAALKKANACEKIVIITDPLVNELWGGILRSSLKSEGFSFDIIEVPRGEHYKNLQSRV